MSFLSFSLWACQRSCREKDERKQGLSAAGLQHPPKQESHLLPVKSSLRYYLLIHLGKTYQASAKYVQDTSRCYWGGKGKEYLVEWDAVPTCLPYCSPPHTHTQIGLLKNLLPLKVWILNRFLDKRLIRQLVQLGSTHLILSSFSKLLSSLWSSMSFLNSGVGFFSILPFLTRTSRSR